MPGLDEERIKTLLAFQRNEISEYHIYTKIAAMTKETANRTVLERIARMELGHYHTWRKYTGTDTGPDRIQVVLVPLAARIFGMTFAIRLMEAVEHRRMLADETLSALIPEMPEVLAHEEARERDLIALLDEERLKYVGSVVLGLNDALVEFTGTLAGLTFALRDARIIAVAGLIMGVAASLSMGASEYLSQRSDARKTDPFRASVYTGLSYILTVTLLILPFLLLPDPFIALVFTFAGAVAVIFFFTFYLSVAKELPFWHRFFEMTAISLGIAFVSFLIGMAIRVFLNMDM